jgi:3-hydroxymyristoyl/3-hydroxydecanoyl-(acyl carrier protein) dehydratase
MAAEQCEQLYREQAHAAGTLPVSHDTWQAHYAGRAPESPDPWWIHRQSAPDTASALLLVHPRLPCLAGHFPGAPILPGIVQIFWALQLAEEALHGTSTAAFTGIGNAKFLAPLMPGDIALLTLARQSSGNVQARLERPGVVCTRAMLRYGDDG